MDVSGGILGGARLKMDLALVLIPRPEVEEVREQIAGNMMETKHYAQIKH